MSTSTPTAKKEEKEANDDFDSYFGNAPESEYATVLFQVKYCSIDYYPFEPLDAKTIESVLTGMEFACEFWLGYTDIYKDDIIASLGIASSTMNLNNSVVILQKPLTQAWIDKLYEHVSSTEKRSIEILETYKQYIKTDRFWNIMTKLTSTAFVVNQKKQHTSTHKTQEYDDVHFTVMYRDSKSVPSVPIVHFEVIVGLICIEFAIEFWSALNKNVPNDDNNILAALTTAVNELDVPHAMILPKATAAEWVKSITQYSNDHAPTIEDKKKTIETLDMYSNWMKMESFWSTMDALVAGHWTVRRIKKPYNADNTTLSPPPPQPTVNTQQSQPAFTATGTDTIRYACSPFANFMLPAFQQQQAVKK